MEAPRLLGGVQRVVYRRRTQLRFHSYTWVHLWTFRAALVTIGIGYPFLSLLLVVSIFVGGFTVTDLDSPLWIRVGGRLSRVSDQSDQRSDQRDMDSQVVTVDQFAAAMVSIQEAIANLGQRIDGQQTQQVPVQESTQFDTTVPPPPLPSQSVPQAIPFTLHSQIEVAPPPITSPIPASEDPYARMDKLEQKLRQMRTSEGAITWEDFDGAPVASLSAKFRMPEIERYTGIGCPRIHLRLYSTVMRAHGLDDAQMVMLFPMSLSGAAQRWFASLEVSRRRTWDDLAQEFLRQFAFNTVIDVSRRELEALRQRPEESVTSFISRWREKISQIIDRPPEKDQISMIMRSLQPRFARHLMGFPHTDFGSLVQALYGIEEGIARGLCSAGMRPSRRYQTVGQTPGLTACFAAHVVERPPAPYIRPPSSTDHYLCAEATTLVCSVGYAFESSFSEARRGWIIDSISIQAFTPTIPPHFRMDLHCSYHQGPGHDTDHCTALRHAIQDLIDQGLVNLGQPSVTTNPLPAHVYTRHGPQTPAPFSLIPDEAPFQLTHPTPLVIGCQDAFVPFTLWPEDDDSAGREIQIVTRSGRITQPPPPAVRPFEGTASHEEVRREDDEVLRQLQSTQARISIWSLLASSSTHRDALIRALNDDLPPDGLDHVRSLYITVGCSGRRVPSVLLDNGSALNVCPLATAIALGFASSDFGPSTQTARAYDSTKREVMGTLMIDLQIGPATFFHFVPGFEDSCILNMLLGRPWIHVVGAIPFSLHQKVKFIHDGQVITVRSTRDIFASSEPVLQISHSEDDLLLTGFTLMRYQTLEIEDFCRDFVAMSFDQHSSTVVLDMMRGMTFLPGMGLGRRQQGPSEFIAAIDHDTTFGLGFIPIEADYRHMARLRKERVRARLSHTPFDYPIRPYRMSLADYFVRGSETRPRLEEIDSVAHTNRETDLQHLFHQLQLSDGAPDTFFPMTITPTSPDRASMLSLCFPEEITSDGVIVDLLSQIAGIVQLQPVSAFDMFGVSTIEVFEGTQTLPVSRAPEDDSSLFEGIVSPVEGTSDLVDPPLSFDVLSGFVSRSDDIFDIDDEIAHPSSDRDSFDHDSDERDRLIHLLMSYWMSLHGLMRTCPGLDPSIVQHHLPTLPHARPVKQKIEMVASTLEPTGHSMLSFMDGFFRVQSDFDGSEDMEKTTFITEWGTYCYRVMPFGLKNAGATYQRAATTLFHDMMHRDVEVYVDDMIVKSRGRADHLDALERFFERIRKFRLRLNPKKCTFGVTSGKLLGHMYISRFIARLTDICEPIFRLLRKNQPTVWNDDCQFAFEKIKEYLLSPPVLVPPTPGRPLLLYLSVSDMALGCMLAQIDDLGKERAIYYLSKRMLEYEMRYVMIERLCLALVWATRRLRHYMTEYSVHLISRLDPLRYLFDRPALTGRLMRWLVLLTEFDIQYVSQKSIKGSIVADHLASLPTSEDRPVDDDFPDEEFVAMTSLSGWCMYFDGAANQSGYGIGVLLVSPQGDHIPRSADSGDWKTRDVKLRPYHAYLELLVARFDDLRYVHLPRAQNRFADALATLASSVDIPIDVVIRPLLIESRSAPAYCCLIGEIEDQDDLPWYHDIYQFLRSGTYPEVATTKDRRALRHLATRFVICGDTLYRRSADGMLLLCLDRASADRVMREVHSGVCGPHMGGHMLARKIMRTGYFWLTMETDCCQFVQKCPECQIHGDLIHAPPSDGHEFILVAIDYFTKWVEAASYARLTSARVASFIRSHIICRYGEYGIRHHRSSAYRPQTNGAVEAANKNIKRILRKMVETSRDWSEKLPFALWAYRTSFRTSTGATPYSLVYGMEAVLPVETEMGSLRVALEQQISETEWAQARFDQLNLLDERRLRAADHVQAYQRKMARAFKKRVKPRPLQKGDLVLRILRGLIGDPRGKFRPSWSGPYVIRELTPEGAAWLTDLDGNQFSEPTNVDQLKKYYV
ncbi:Retrovirus-related Pol polyprotein from transposon 17.6 [Vitis vinifera]|uniref:Retrovirus-related Pol polyprotein from transposon 17.6 n=2 Tax=Vitis vinifera TaxID=29760 RepID=A0A438D0V6_VITVI|nr:Retrovirus-related Pol polyprotein from transposon 17.6 [Vitis vinifera]